jgi:hypothetical protein
MRALRVFFFEKRRLGGIRLAIESLGRSGRMQVRKRSASIANRSYAGCAANNPIPVNLPLPMQIGPGTSIAEPSAALQVMRMCSLR